MIIMANIVVPLRKRGISMIKNALFTMAKEVLCGPSPFLWPLVPACVLRWHRHLRHIFLFARCWKSWRQPQQLAAE